MNTKQLNLFKTLLFIFGFAIIGFLMYLNVPKAEDGTAAAFSANQKFFWGEMFFCYAVFFIPFFYSTINFGNMDVKITSTVTIWISVLFFEVVAITFAVLSLKGIVAIKWSVLVELVVFFISGILIYFGYFAGNHIEGVQAAEQKSLGKLAEVKNAFEMLNIKAGMWSEEYADQKKSVMKICDDVRYLSPVDTEMSSAVEMKLIIAAGVLADSTMAPADMNSKIMELTALVSQRKLMRK